MLAALPALRTLSRGLVDLLMPPLCLACKAPVETALAYCPDCWANLPVNDGARCAICDHPLPGKWQLEELCLGCRQRAPAFARARAPFLYAGAVRQTVLALKAGREPYAAPMAKAMLRVAGDMVAPDMLPDMVVVPVPLHRWRLLGRGFNQAAALASRIASATNTTLLPDSLLRVRATRRTRGMNFAQRQRNVRGVFHIPPAQRPRINGRPVLLIDDVMTTGATASACARWLLRAGATSVSVLVYARVARTDPTPYLVAKESDTDAED